MCYTYTKQLCLHTLTVPTSTRRMAIANGTCVSFCNQPKAHYLPTSRQSRRYAVCECRHLATLRESKAHFGLPKVRPWDNRGKCYMDRKRIQCWSNASQYIAIYLQPFLKYSDISVASNRFSTVNEVNERFLPHFSFPGYAPGTIAVNVTWMDRGFNADQTHRSMYLSIFNRLRAIERYWSEIATFLPPCI